MAPDLRIHTARLSLLATPYRPLAQGEQGQELAQVGYGLAREHEDLEALAVRHHYITR